MELSKADLHILCDMAMTAALKAGKFVLGFSKEHLKVEHKSVDTPQSHKPKGGLSLASQVVTEADRQSQDIILSELAPGILKFELAILAEEGTDDLSRFDKDYFWCVDPLDGTLPFVRGQAGYSVSIGLVSKAGESVIGVLYDPVSDHLYHAIEGEQAWCNGEMIHLDHMTFSDTLTFTHDLSFEDDPRFVNVKDRLSIISDGQNSNTVNVQYCGGAAMNAIQILKTKPCCYFKFPKKEPGGGSLWDFAATSCIVKAAGGHVSDIHGNTLDLNRKDSTFMNHHGVLYASSETLANSVMDIFVNEDPRG